MNNFWKQQFKWILSQEKIDEEKLKFVMDQSQEYLYKVIPELKEVKITWDERDFMVFIWFMKKNKIEDFIREYIESVEGDEFINFLHFIIKQFKDHKLIINVREFNKINQMLEIDFSFSEKLITLLELDKLSIENINKIEAPPEAIEVFIQNKEASFIEAQPNKEIINIIFPRVKNKDKMIESASPKLISGAQTIVDYIKENIGDWWRKKLLYEDDAIILDNNPSIISAFTKEHINHILDFRNKDYPTQKIYNLLENNDDSRQGIIDLIEKGRKIDSKKIQHHDVAQKYVDKFSINPVDIMKGLKVTPKTQSRIGSWKKDEVLFDAKHYATLSNKDDHQKLFKIIADSSVFNPMLDNHICIQAFLVQQDDKYISLWSDRAHQHILSESKNENTEFTRDKIINKLKSWSISSIKELRKKFMTKEFKDIIQEFIMNINSLELKLKNIGDKLDEAKSFSDNSNRFEELHREIEKENYLIKKYGMDIVIKHHSQIASSEQDRKQKENETITYINKKNKELNRRNAELVRLLGPYSATTVRMHEQINRWDQQDETIDIFKENMMNRLEKQIHETQIQIKKSKVKIDGLSELISEKLKILKLPKNNISNNIEGLSKIHNKLSRQIAQEKEEIETCGLEYVSTNHVNLIKKARRKKTANNKNAKNKHTKKVN